MTLQIAAQLSLPDQAVTEIGQQRRAPVTVADIDLGAIKEAMAETIERVKTDDPKRLRAEVARLQRELASAQAAKPEPVIERVEVPVLSEELLVRLEAALEPVAGVLGEVQERLAWEVTQRGSELEYRRTAKVPQEPPSRRGAPRQVPPATPARETTAKPRGQFASPSDAQLGKGERMVLVAIAQYAVGVTREQLTRGRPEKNDCPRDKFLEITKSIWSFATAPRNGSHPAPYPAELVRRCLWLSTWPGDVVLDPFCGSGTTCRVAEQMGRRSVGFDLSEVYCREIVAKGSQAPLFDFTAEDDASSCERCGGDLDCACGVCWSCHSDAGTRADDDDLDPLARVVYTEDVAVSEAYL